MSPGELDLVIGTIMPVFGSDAYSALNGAVNGMIVPKRRPKTFLWI
jgi:hypothetical protein